MVDFPFAPRSQNDLSFEGYTYVIAAGATQDVNFYCNYIRIQNVAGVTVNPTIRINGQGNITGKNGLGFRMNADQRGDYWQKMTIINNDPTPLTITLNVGFGEIFDDSTIIDPSSGTLNVLVVNNVPTVTTAALADISIAAATQVQISAGSPASNGRRILHVNNPPFNSEAFKIGDNNNLPTATAGFNLAPGESMIIEQGPSASSGNVHAFNMSTIAAQTITLSRSSY